MIEFTLNRNKMVVAILYLSVRTKCLTAIKLERKHEK